MKIFYDRCIFVFLLLLHFNYCSAADYYVGKSGSDSYSGSKQEPFLHIQYAVDMLQAGDTVYVMKGVYAERIKFHVSGTLNNLIRLMSYANDSVIIDGATIQWQDKEGGLVECIGQEYISLYGLQIRNASSAAIFVENAKHIRIENVHTHNSYSSGIGVWNSQHIVLNANEISLACNDGGEECISIAYSNDVNVTHNNVHHNGAGTLGGEGIDIKEGSFDVMVAYNHVHHLHQRIGLYADAWDTHTYNITFLSNRVNDCTNAGMAVASEMGGLLEKVYFINNIVYDNSDGGMIVGGWTADGEAVPSNPVEHIVIVNNTFYANQGSDGLYVGNVDAKDIKIYNNIFSQNDDSQLYIDYTPLEEVEIANNLIDGVSTFYTQANMIEAKPLFVDVSSKDFRLQKDSPAINKGKRYDKSSRDYALHFRDAYWDIGAYEYSHLQQIEQFVTRFYQVILGRTPDSAGLVDWSNKLEGLSKSGADIAKGFIFSTEYDIDTKSDTEYLNTLYSAFFDREGDAEGLAYWHKQIASGASRNDILDGFLNSLEFKNLTESYGIIANATPVELFVSRFYKQTLLRNPDAAGLADWTNRLNTGIASGSDVAFGFVFSNEFIARSLNNNDFVTVLYRAFFGREPDTAGFNGWLTQLNAGTTREAVLQGFLGAVEFANLAGEYGIRVR